jgi:FAD/FMN-containing dehydrogenase
MDGLLKELATFFNGDIETNARIRYEYSHDTSIYELMPEAVLKPKDSQAICKLVEFVAAHKHQYPALSLVPRGAGSNMSGGAIGSSLVIDTRPYLNKIHKVSRTELQVESGVLLSNIEAQLSEKSAMLASMSAGRSFGTIGGMIANNSGGEKSLCYGKANRSVRQLSIVLSDGKEYVIKPLNQRELNIKMNRQGFEREVYCQLYKLIDDNYDFINNHQPKVNKNSMGYNLWSIWDRDAGIFDLTQLFTGSQGTLGIITDIKLHPVPKAKYSSLLLMYVTNLKQLSKIISLVLDHRPAVFEVLDDIALDVNTNKHFALIRQQLGLRDCTKQQITLFGSKIHPHKGPLNNLILLVEFDGDTIDEIADCLFDLQQDLKRHKIKLRTALESNIKSTNLFWRVHNNSLAMLRKQVKDIPVLALIDDVVIPVKYTAEFIVKVRYITKKYRLPTMLTGHLGDGNFHIIPYKNIDSATIYTNLETAMREILELVLKYGGTLAGEYNDGLVRGPWLPAVFGDEMYSLFKTVKHIFDPCNIFNPHKKTDANWDFSTSHMRCDLK